jgi:NADH:ubiquinone oxidoreductase subunit F (NADH-binding)
LSGESSAIIRAVQGGPALPRTTFEPGRSWAGGPPVLVHNVETLARLGMLARTGAEFHKPSSLVTVTDRDRRLVVEVPARERFGEVFNRVGVPAPQAVLLGGYGGEWVSWEELAGLRVDPQALRASGRSLGAGVLLALPRGHCGLRATAPIAAWLAGESAGQCGPCRFGLPAIADLTTRLAGRPRRRDLGRLRELLGLVDGRGACRLPDGAVRMLRSALQTFAAEVELHRRGQCTARDGRR